MSVIVSDGGPDQRVTFGSVQVAAVALFCALDLDMVVFVRTCPYQSWQNVAERVMSTLNVAQQNVSLARMQMLDRFESLVRNRIFCQILGKLSKLYLIFVILSEIQWPSNDHVKPKISSYENKGRAYKCWSS